MDGEHIHSRTNIYIPLLIQTEENTGEKVIQLETAVGAAIKHFRNAHGINVPRSRFLPVKSCSDLFVVQSDLYTLKNGVLAMDGKRFFGTVPIVKLGDHFKKVGLFHTFVLVTDAYIGFTSGLKFFAPVQVAAEHFGVGPSHRYR